MTNFLSLLLSSNQSKHGKDIKKTLEEKFNGQIKVVGDKFKFDVEIFRSFF